MRIVRKTKNMQGGAWKEIDLEKWLWENPVLPGGEILLPVMRQKPLSRVVDLLFLDCRSRLVLVEIKNERSTRLAVGQALEYLSAYHDYGVDDLCEDAGTDLRADYARTFGKPLEALEEERRVLIAAPGFDTASSVACVYLNQVLRGVTVSMLRAVRSTHNFVLETHQAPNFVPAKKLAAKDLALSPAGRRIYFVLESGPAPLVWWVGREKRTGGLSVPTTRRSLLRRLHRRVVPTDGPQGLDLRHHGSMWQRKKNSQQLARVLGYLKTSSRQVAVIVRIRPGKAPAVRVWAMRRFLRDWSPSEAQSPSWAELERELQKEAKR